MSPISWHYRCSLCGELVHPDNMVAHVKAERAKPTWPGHITWTWVDDPPEERPGASA